ncbi:hypothetical protein HK098_007985 [Nowakowskiella sp. JEL0407]|nr:hypothetical protein HK098_007985 [Nowakowskiella sp. JEL0407]
MALRVVFSTKQGGNFVIAYGALAVAQATKAVPKALKKIHIEYDPNSEKDVALTDAGTTLLGTNRVARYLGRLFPEAKLYTGDSASLAQVDYWLDYTQENLVTKDKTLLEKNLEIINHHLKFRSFFVGYHVTLADLVVWGALRGNAIFLQTLKSERDSGEYLSRWYNQINSLDYIQKSFTELAAQKQQAQKAQKDQGSFEIDLPGAAKGKVVTRFPPEPSGYLHIGHAKAALLNEYFARKFEGKLIVRFDDTNPSKEKVEFEESIKEDLALLGITPDEVTHTSDHFEKIYELAVKLIKKGLAYVDDTDLETMRAERMEHIESKNRNLSVEENLRLFNEMKLGTPKGVACALRAKINMQDKNGAMRDPVIYRCNVENPHHRTGTKWKVYPTYDLACPIVDSLEGVTHALRTSEYRDRNIQYQWFIDALELRKVHIWDFSRINFVYTLLSKRKLTWFVEKGRVGGWDDPRFPTVRGIRRRGMTINALREYILMQGASQKDLMLEWDKIWAKNKKEIDPIAPRHTALKREGIVKVRVLDDDCEFKVEDRPKHKKNPDVGMKKTTYSRDLYLEFDDAKDLEVGEEVTFMDWGNVIVKSIKWHPDSTYIGLIEIQLNLSGDFKKTKKKLSWLSRTPESASPDNTLVPLVLLDYDYLINKKKLEEDDSLEEFLTEVSEFKTDAWGDANLRHCKKGDIIQLERKGFYIVDTEFSDDEPMHLIFIPDGSAESMKSKASEPTKPAVAAKAAVVVKPMEKVKEVKKVVKNEGAVKTSMYKQKPIYDHPPVFEHDKISKMYKMASVYGAEEVVETQTVVEEVKVDEVAPKAEAKKEKKEKKAAAAPEVVAPAGEGPLVSKLDMVVGKVLSVKRHPDADTLYVEEIDCGEAEPRTVVSGLVKFLKEDEINGREVVILKNLKPAAMRGIKSFAMVMCASNDDHTVVELLIPPVGSKAGDRVFIKDHEGEPEAQLNPKKKVFETVQPGFKTSDDLVATWNGNAFMTSKGVVKSKTLKGASIK